MTDDVVARVKVAFELPSDGDGWPPVGVETVWAVRRDDGCVELDNIPLFARGFAAGDVVRVESDEDGLFWVKDAVTCSDNCTIRLVPLGEGDSKEKRRIVLETFARLGVEGEGLNRFNLVALNVPASVDVRAVKQLVVQGAEDGRWHCEEGCVTPEWRAAG